MKAFYMIMAMLLIQNTFAIADCKLEAQYQQVTIASVEPIDQTTCKVKLDANSVIDYRVSQYCLLMGQPVLEWKSVVEKGILVRDENGKMCAGKYQSGQILPGGYLVEVGGKVYFD